MIEFLTVTIAEITLLMLQKKQGDHAANPAELVTLQK